LTNSRNLLQNSAPKNAVEPPGGTLKDVNRNTKTKTKTKTETARIKPPSKRQQTSGTGDRTREPQVDAAEAETIIEAFDPLRSRPQKCSADFWRRRGEAIKRAVREAATSEPQISVRMSLTTLTGFLVWVEQEHLEGDLNEVLTGRNIDRYAAQFSKAAASRRHALRVLAKALEIELEESKIWIPKQSLAAGYSEDEMLSLLEYAENLTNLHRRKRLLANILLGAGAGLVRGAQTGVCRGAIHRHNERHDDRSGHDGMFLRLDTHCRPIHPLLTSTAETLAQLFSADEDLVESGRSKNHHNKPKKWVPKHLPEYNLDKMRSTYVQWVLETGYPLKATLLYVGMMTVSGLAGYLPHLQEPKAGCSE